MSSLPLRTNVKTPVDDILATVLHLNTLSWLIRLSWATAAALLLTAYVRNVKDRVRSKHIINGARLFILRHPCTWKNLSGIRLFLCEISAFMKRVPDCAHRHAVYLCLTTAGNADFRASASIRVILVSRLPNEPIFANSKASIGREASPES